MPVMNRLGDWMTSLRDQRFNIMYCRGAAESALFLNRLDRYTANGYPLYYITTIHLMPPPVVCVSGRRRLAYIFAPTIKRRGNDFGLGDKLENNLANKSPEMSARTNGNAGMIPIACRTALAELPPVLQDVQLKDHRLEGLGANELWELTRKCHLFRSIDLSGWKGVSVLSFRSLCLAVGASLQTVSFLFLFLYLPPLHAYSSIQIASYDRGSTVVGRKRFLKFDGGFLNPTIVSI